MVHYSLNLLGPMGQVSESTVQPCPSVHPTEPTVMAAQVAGVSRQRAAAQGLGSNQKAVKYLGQDFKTLRQQCLDSGVLFKDPEFPACPSALGYKDLGPCSPQTQGIIWKRPTELCPSPQFIIGGATRTDICQGGLGKPFLFSLLEIFTILKITGHFILNASNVLSFSEYSKHTLETDHSA
ncbi:Calpain-8 [Plecturocebus cupreus]